MPEDWVDDLAVAGDPDECTHGRSRLCLMQVQIT